MNNQSLSVLAFTAALGFSGAAGAGLIDRGGGLIYDDVLNITWLQDANYAFTSGYAAANLENDGGYDDILADGRMGWDAAKTWAANLTYYDSVRGVTYDDWRLPIITDTETPGCNRAYTNTDCGYNVATSASELAYMFHVNLGNLSAHTTAGSYRGGSNGVNWGVVNTSFVDAKTSQTVSFQNFQNYGYGPVLSTRRIPMARGSSTPTTAIRSPTIRATRSTHGPCAPAMSPPPPLLPSPNRAVLRWSG